MRNFGPDSFVSQQHFPHHQLPPLQPTIPKMEEYPLTKTVGVGTNLNKQQPNKSHFSPVRIVAPAAHQLPLHHHHHPHHQNHLSSTSSSGHNGIINSSSHHNNGIPINLSHSHHGIGAAVSASAASHGSHLLPTAALAAACPTANRGPSPAHQQIPASGLPYHPSHSPTLPIANTALPSEIQSGPALSGNSASNSPVNVGGSSPYYQHNGSYLTKIQHHPYYQESSPRITADLASSSSSNDSQTPSSNSNSVSGSLPKGGALEVTSAHPSSASGDKSVGNPHMASSAPGGNSGSNSSTSDPARIVSQNVNGTLAVTGIPSNESELQLFRVLQRANLLSYFDMMIELGGDDVQQLCEAGEQEFLEIMALIGMAAKPLHVRRLQKALQEWMTQPSLFQSPVLPPGYQHFGVSHLDRTISHTQYTTTIASSNVTAGGAAQHQHPHHPLPVIPPQLLSHNPISPYPASSHPAPPYFVESNTASSDPTSNGNQHKKLKLSSDQRSSSPSSSLPTTTNANVHIGLHIGAHLQQQHQSSPPPPSAPVVISTQSPSSYTSGQGQSGYLSSSEQLYQNCPSPSGSTSSRSSTISIKSHPKYQPSSPMEISPGSPADSVASGRSKHHDDVTTSSELEVASPSPSEQTYSPQSLDNSTGTTRVASQSQSSSCGSEPSSPAPPQPPPSSSSYTFKGMISHAPDSPRPSIEPATNRMIPSSNNSVTGCTSTSQDFSLQDHEIQKLAETAMNLVRSLPQSVQEPKLSKKIETSSYEYVLRLGEDDPRKMEEIRRLSAIFLKCGEQQQQQQTGKRAKSSSKNVNNNNSPNRKPVSILELAMNEAAAQLCKHIPALLTKRDEMFGLSRQVIRESGLPYAVISANSNLPASFMAPNNNNTIESRLELRNSPAQEERISFEFAAACKKIKLDSQESVVTRKPPVIENNLVTLTALKRMAAASMFRKNNLKTSVTVQT